MASEYLKCPLKELFSSPPGDEPISLLVPQHKVNAFSYYASVRCDGLKPQTTEVLETEEWIEYFGFDPDQTLQSVIDWALRKGIKLTPISKVRSPVAFSLAYQYLTVEERIEELLEKKD